MKTSITFFILCFSVLLSAQNQIIHENKSSKSIEYISKENQSLTVDSWQNAIYSGNNLDQNIQESSLAMAGNHFQKLYGNSNPNYFEKVIPHNNFYYVIGGRSSVEFPSVTKIDNMGNIVWSKEIPSPGKWEDIIINSDDNLLLVGWLGQLDNANQSMIGVVNSTTGNFISLKSYDFNQDRELLLKIYLNPVPASATAPYYVYGIEGDPFTDLVMLTTIDKDGNIGFRKTVAVNGGDNEFSRDVSIDGRTGQTIIVGNGRVSLPTNQAITATLDNNANTIGTRLFDFNGAFYSILTKSNPIAGFNHILGGINNDAGGATLVKVNGPSVEFAYKIPQLTRISKLTPGNNSGEFLAIGHGNFGGINRPVIISYTDNGSSLTQNWAKSFFESETAYGFGYITLDNVNFRYVYTDGRTNNPDGFGQMDAFLSVDSLNLNNCLDIPIILLTEQINVSFQEFQPVTVNVPTQNGNPLTSQIPNIQMIDICECETIPPVITCPANITLNCNEEIDPKNTGTAVASDNSGMNPSIISSLSATTYVNCVGTTFQTFVATDSCGNTSSCVQTIITFNDNISPTFTNCGRKVILNGVVGANGNCGLVTVVVGPDVSDNCDNMLTLTNSFNPTDEDASGYYPVGTTIVNWTVKDDCGNMSMCQDTIIILPCGSCQGLNATLTPVMTDNDSLCCYALNLDNSQGPLAVDHVTLSLITSDWIMNTLSVNTGAGYTYNTTTSTIDNAGGIPFGYNANVATICLVETSPMANDTQCIKLSWGNNEMSLGCFDTLKAYCEPPVEEKDTCFSISNVVIECDPSNDLSYCVKMRITNLSAINMRIFEMDAIAGYLYGSACSGCTSTPPGTIGGPITGGGWGFFFSGSGIPPSGFADVCFKITSTSPILSPTPIYTFGKIESPQGCCHSPKRMCFTLNPCCDPCESISVNLTPLQNQDSCCYKLDLNYTCDYAIFDEIVIDLMTPGVQISSFGVLNSAWMASVDVPGHVVSFAPVSGGITSSNDGALVNFCISGVDDPSEIPQYLNIHFHSSHSSNNELIHCDTLLKLECADKGHPCLIVTNHEVECDTVNKKYIITMDVTNNSSPAFTAEELYIFHPFIMPNPVTFTGSLLPTETETITFCYTPPTFPDPFGLVIFEYALKDAMGNCCLGAEVFYDTIQLPDCVDSCFFLQCAQTKFQFDVETRNLGNLTSVANFGIFPYHNNPQVVRDGCNGTDNSVELRGITRGYTGDAMGVKKAGVVGLDTLGKTGEECCLTFCHKMKKGLASTSATLEVFVNGFISGQTQHLGYYTYTNDLVWDETQIKFIHPFNVKEIVFRNVSTDPLDVPQSIFIDDIRLGMAIRVKDTIPPVIDCPFDITVLSDEFTPFGAPCEYDFYFTGIDASDNSGLYSMSCTIDGVPAIVGNLYTLVSGVTHVVHCIAIDSCDNADTCSYKIDVECKTIIDDFCTCPVEDETTFNLTTNGTNYALSCNQSLSTVPRLGCPSQDVRITGQYACDLVLLDSFCTSLVGFEVKDPDGNVILAGSSTLADNLFDVFIPASDLTIPGVYAMTISTVCPGSNDTCKCEVRWIQENCDSLCACSGELKPNLVTNGNFSMGNIGFASDLLYSNSCSAGAYWVDDMFSDKCPGWGGTMGGNPGNFLMIDGFTTGTNFNLWRQAVSLLPGRTYKLCFETTTPFGFPFNMNIGIKDGSSTFHLIATEIIPASFGSWVPHTVSITVPSTLIGPFTIQFNQTALDTTGYSDFGIDNICLTEDKKQDPLCKCGGFSGVKFCVSGSNPILAECNLQNKIYDLPCPNTGLVNFCGDFNCNPDTCSPSTVNLVITNTTTGSVIHTATVTLNAAGHFSVNLLGGWFSDPTAVYQIKTSGICGTDTCMCTVKFKVNCPQQSMCKCDQQFFTDVAQGFLQSSMVGNCQRKFEPKVLCPTDKVDWYRNGSLVASTVGMTASTFGVFAGYGNVCMIVTRTVSPNEICRDTFCGRTFCEPEGLADCSGLENSGLLNDIDGYLDDDGTMINWTKEEGWPYAFASEGISGGNIMLVASKDMPSSVAFNWSPPNQNFKINEISMDVESYLSTPIPEGTKLEVINSRANGQMEVVSSMDASGYRKGWDGTIKGAYHKLEFENGYKFILRLSAISQDPVYLRFDNVCFDLVTATDDEVHNQPEVLVYPNPNTGKFTIKAEFINETSSEVNIYNTQGVKVDGFTFHQNEKHEADISHLPDGLYILHLKLSDGSLLTKKLIKMN